MSDGIDYAKPRGVPRREAAVLSVVVVMALAIPLVTEGLGPLQSLSARMEGTPWVIPLQEAEQSEELAALQRKPSVGWRMGGFRSDFDAR